MSRDLLNQLPSDSRYIPVGDDSVVYFGTYVVVDPSVYVDVVTGVVVRNTVTVDVD